MRRIAVLATLVAAAFPASAGVVADRPELTAPDARELQAYRISDSTLPRRPRLLSASVGEYATPSGATVRIEVSDSYEPDEAESQMWADFVDSLVHGAEIERVTIFFAPFQEMQSICGRQAAACYAPSSGTIVVPGEDIENGPTVEALLAHEYGHHVGASRTNAPWRAVTYGTKRWATSLGVCPRVTAGELVTGGGGDAYEVNPGEIFAESYRVLNQRRLGIEESPWEIVSQAYYPSERALRLLEQDVLEPWTKNTAVTLRGRGTRTVRVATPLDGVFRATISGPRGTVYRVAAPTTVCGQRFVNVRVTRVRGTGAYTLRVSRP